MYHGIQERLNVVPFHRLMVVPVFIDVTDGEQDTKTPLLENLTLIDPQYGMEVKRIDIRPSIK